MSELTPEQIENGRIDAEKKAESDRIAAEKKAEAERKAAEKKVEAVKKDVVNAISGNGNIRIILPLIPGSKDHTVEVVINGQFFLLKRGVPIDVSPEIAEVLTNAQAAEMQYMLLSEDLSIRE